MKGVPKGGSKWTLKTDTSGLEGVQMGTHPTGHIVSNRGSQTDPLFGGTPKALRPNGVPPLGESNPT